MIPLLMAGLLGASPMTTAGQLDLPSFAASNAPGSWAEYQALEGGKAAGFAFRVVLVDAPWEGRVRRWLEVWFDGAGRIALRLPVDVAGLGSAPTIYKYGATFFRMERRREVGGACAIRPPTPARMVRLRTAAGEFKCHHSKSNGVEIWASERARPLTLVKALLAGGHGYQLATGGEAAKTAFPERFALVPMPGAAALVGRLPSGFGTRRGSHPPE
jgi:hypothetical protein